MNERLALVRQDDVLQVEISLQDVLLRLRHEAELLVVTAVEDLSIRNRNLVRQVLLLLMMILLLRLLAWTEAVARSFLDFD